MKTTTTKPLATFEDNSDNRSGTLEDNLYETTQECLKTNAAKTTQGRLTTTTTNRSGKLQNNRCNTAQERLKTTTTKTAQERLKTTATSRSRKLENNGYKQSLKQD